MSTSKQEFLIGTTKNKLHYIDVWNSHVDSLSRLGYPLLSASEETELLLELQLITNRLRELIHIAADESFKNE